MFHKILSLYLTLVALAGPGLCYCNILQLTHQKIAINSHKSQSSQTKHRHQCGCKNSQKKHSAPVQPCSSNPACPSCPCNHHEKIPVALPTVDSTLNLCFDFSKELSVFESVLSPLNGVAHYLGDALSMTYLSGWHQCQFSALGMLRAPFVLLC